MVAAVAGSDDVLASLGVADSKTLSDKRCLQLAAQVHAHAAVEVVAIGPEKYNELYAKFKNLNRLLAWAHSRALENLLAKQPVARVLADQFAHPKVLESALLERGAQVELIQAPRSERHPVVAAASVVARAEFLTKLEALGKKIDFVLPKGAGSPVDEAGRKLLARGGVELLRQVAKLHFKNSQKLGAGSAGLL